MASTQPRYSKEEFARHGEEIYKRDIRPRLKAEDNGKFVAIDIETGAYEIEADELAACDRLRARLPDAQIWLVRVGSRFVRRFGCRVQGGARRRSPRSRGAARTARRASRLPRLMARVQ